jgi:hypothetical protein
MKYQEIRKTVPSVHLLDENAATIPWYMVLARYVPYSEAFKDKIDQMISNGLIKRFHDKTYNVETSKKRFVEEVEPQVLTVYHLKLGFLAVLICLALSFAVFLTEVIVNAIYLWISPSPTD